MQYKRMPIEVESPEELGYYSILNNLAESSVRDLKLSDLRANLDDLILNYGDHSGLHELRKIICEDSEKINAENILVCQAAAMALFIVNTSILSQHDHLIVIRPNYATNLETPKAIGCEITYIDLHFDNNYTIDISQLKKAIKPNTKLISITAPHNPTGKVFDENTIDQIIKLADENMVYLLIDETYRELNFKSALQPYFADRSENIISVSSISKAYGLPGIRIGWIICQNKNLLELFLAAKEQIIICNSVVDEHLAYCALLDKATLLNKSHLAIAQNFEITKNWIENHTYLEWNEPAAGAVGFIRFKENTTIDLSLFYKILYDSHKTLVGPGHWFEQSDRYFRLGFGYPTTTELINGIKAIDLTIDYLTHK